MDKKRIMLISGISLLLVNLLIGGVILINRQYKYKKIIVDALE